MRLRKCHCVTRGGGGLRGSTPPPQGFASRLFIVKGAGLRSTLAARVPHTPWAPKASESSFCPLCTPPVSLNRTLTLTPTPTLVLVMVQFWWSNFHAYSWGKMCNCDHAYLAPFFYVGRMCKVPAKTIWGAQTNNNILFDLIFSN